MRVGSRRSLGPCGPVHASAIARQASLAPWARARAAIVQQQPFAVGFVAGKDVRLYGGAERDDFVGVEVVQRGLSEEGGDRLLNVQHTGGTADHNHAFDVGFGHACVFQCLFHRLYGFLHQILRQVVKFLAGNDGMDFAAV